MASRLTMTSRDYLVSLILSRCQKTLVQKLYFSNVFLSIYEPILILTLQFEKKIIVCRSVKVFKRLKVCILVHREIPSNSYGTSLAIWDHTTLPATWHKWTRPALTPASKPVLDLPTPEGFPAMQRPGIYTVSQKKHVTKLLSISLSNIDRFLPAR